MGTQETGSTPGFELLGTDAESLRHLIQGQHSFRTQPLETTLQSIFDPHVSDHPASKWVAITGEHAARVQDICNGPGRMVIQ
jgi:hypothetical protein